jgi:outer membrane murein-binding lipoprotein Lpp
MAMPTLEERVARLEANVDHMRSDIAAIKMDLRRLDDKLAAKISALDERVAGKMDSLRDSVSRCSR